MAQEDKIKWNKKYKEKHSLLKDRPASKKLDTIIQNIQKGNALDIACGAGRNSIFLAIKGFNVDAVDISEVALEHLNNLDIKNINAILVDLDHYIPSKEFYDIVVMTNFLDRSLIPKLVDALKTNGYMLIETYMNDPINEKENSNPNFLLQKDELKEFFDGSFKIIDYDEFENESFEMYRMKKQSIIAQKLH